MDLFIGACGYESRCLFAAERLIRLPARGLAIAFPSQQVLAFHRSATAFRAMGFDVETLYDGVVEAWVAEQLHVAIRSRTGPELSLGVDISSLTRVRAAMIVAAIMDASAESGVGIRTRFYYSPARFDVPPRAVPVDFFGPVHQRFQGCLHRVDLPTVAIVGLGYEPDRAIGSVELLEPATVWAFIATGGDARYRKATVTTNRTFLDILPEGQVLPYDLSKPEALLARLLSLATFAGERSRPVIFPFGPKLFSLVAVLAALRNPAVGVWRVSAGTGETPIDRRPTGELVTFEFLFAVRGADCRSVVVRQ